MSEQAAMRYCPVCTQQTLERFCPADGARTLLQRSFDRDATSYGPGDVVGERYRITGMLGKGAFGAVYSARHTGTDQPCALKMLTADTSGKGGDTNVQRFFREARITAGLNHPNTVRVFDVGQAEHGPLYLVMELLRGPSFDEYLADLSAKGEVLSEHAAIDIGTQVLRSLNQAHKAGLVHRDIKPGNILLSPGPEEDTIVKVLDFGIARVAGAKHITATGLAIGTPAYMSPEQCMGRELDGRADLYSLAVTLYQAVAGRLPFDSDDAMSLMFSHCRDTPSEPTVWSPQDLTRPFVDCLMMALEKEPEHRQADALEMREEFESIRAAAWVDQPKFTTDQVHFRRRIDPWGATESSLGVASEDDASGELGDEVPATVAYRRTRGRGDEAVTDPDPVPPQEEVEADEVVEVVEAEAEPELPATVAVAFEPTAPTVKRLPPLPKHIPVVTGSSWNPATLGIAVAAAVLAIAVLVIVSRDRARPATEASTQVDAQPASASAAPAPLAFAATPVAQAAALPAVPAPAPVTADAAALERRVTAQVAYSLSVKAITLAEQMAYARRATKLAPNETKYTRRLLALEAEAQLRKQVTGTSRKRPAERKVKRRRPTRRATRKATAAPAPTPEPPKRRKVAPQFAD